MRCNCCLDLIKQVDQARLECCLSVELITCPSPATLEICQEECPSRPSLKYLLDTEVNGYYLVKVTGQLIESDGICFFAQSKEECPETIQHRQISSEYTSEGHFCLIFKFKALTSKTFVGLRFLNGQMENKAELTRFEVCPAQVPLPKHHYPMIIPICQRDIGKGDKLILCQPGHYQLTEDINFSCKTAIVIDSCHVRLDLNHHRITGQDCQTNDAILVNKAGFELQNITIENGLINCPGGSGLNLIKVKDSHLNNLQVNKAKQYGFRFADCNKVTVRDSQACQNQGSGFLAKASKDIHYLNCSAQSNHLDGFYLGQPDNCRVNYKNCQATENQENGFLLTGENHQVYDSQSYANGLIGFDNQSTDSHFYHNRAENNLGANYQNVELVVKPNCKTGYWVNVDSTADPCPDDCGGC